MIGGLIPVIPYNAVLYLGILCFVVIGLLPYVADKG
jgi:hypothetical protein